MGSSPVAVGTIHDCQSANGHAASGGENRSGADQANLMWKLRKYLMLLAILAATVTYTAGLGPPGGFWQDSKNGHLAGDLILPFNYPRRYEVFFYCNTTAFVASVIVLILLLVRGLSRNQVWLRSLQIAMLLDLLGLMGAYAAGSCREVSTSIYTWVLLLGIFAYVTIHAVLFRHVVPECAKRRLRDIKRWCKERMANFFEKEDEAAQPLTRDEKEELERNRSFLLVLATLAATVTYVAGLSPPGGFWPDNQNGYLAGNPMLGDHYPGRFKAFLCCNATSFAASLVIIFMLLSDTAVDHVVKSYALRICVLMSLFGLMGAYAAGSCRKISTSIYVFALVGAVFVYIVIKLSAPFVPKPKPVERWTEWANMKRKKLSEKLNNCLGVQAEATLPMTEEQHPSNDAITASMDDQDSEYVDKSRTYLLLLGVLAASVTYQAGLSPPGGFWPDNQDGHLAGDPILEVANGRRYKAFFYCNATAFVASLIIIIIMIQSRTISTGAMKRHVLQTAMTFDLFGLMGAYAAGSCREFSASVYVLSLVLAVFIYVVFHILLFLIVKLKPPEEARDTVLNNETAADPNDQKDLEKRRKFLMLLAVLAASVTYQAGISPPGGFWTDNNDGHEAGDPVFRDEYPPRYNAFFYCNATAFMASLAVIMLLVSRRLCQKGLECYALRVCVLVDLLSLMGAFAVGSCRKVSASIYVFVVVVAVVVYMLVQVLLLTFAKDKLAKYLAKFTYDIASSRQSSACHDTAGVGDLTSREKKNNDSNKSEHKKRKDLMLIGTLAVTVTYQAGLLPPGGLWEDDGDGHLAGNPILEYNYPRRYKAFFYCNATAFMASVVVVILLLNNTIGRFKRPLHVMKTAMILDLLGLLGAFAAGSCRSVKTSAYVFALVVAVSVYIVFHVVWSFDRAARLVRDQGKRCLRCLDRARPW